MLKNLDNHTIAELQQRVAESDQRAYEHLYRIFYMRLCNFAAFTLHSKEIAEEAVNDVLLKIWNERHKLKEIRNLETYLFVAVRNQSLNYLSKYSHLHISVEEPNSPAEIINLNDPSRELEWKEMYFRLNSAVEQLPEQCRMVFRLIKEEGFKYKEVAEILNIAPKTVETQLYRAFQRLRKVVAEFSDANSSGSKRIFSLLLFPLLFLTSNNFFQAL